MEWIEFLVEHPWLLLVLIVGVLVYIYFRGPSKSSVQDEVDELLEWTRKRDDDDTAP